MFAVELHLLQILKIRYRFKMKKFFFLFSFQNEICWFWWRRTWWREWENWWQPTLVMKRVLNENKISIITVNRSLTSMKMLWLIWSFYLSWVWECVWQPELCGTIKNMKGLFTGWLYRYSKVAWNTTKTQFNWIIRIEIDFSYMKKRNGLNKIDCWEGADFVV
jgi:hypothetical protein